MPMTLFMKFCDPVIPHMWGLSPAVWTWWTYINRQTDSQTDRQTDSQEFFFEGLSADTRIAWLIFLYNFIFQDTVSVHRPSFYAHRFLDFMADKVFKKIPSRKSIHSILSLFNFSHCCHAHMNLLWHAHSPIVLSYRKCIQALRLRKVQIGKNSDHWKI